MKIDRPIRQLLSRTFGLLRSGESRVSFHSQNLNEDRRGNPKGLPWHGRAWLNFYRNARLSDGRPTAEEALGLCLEWALGSPRLGLGLEVDPSEHKILLSWSLPPVTLYFSVEPSLEGASWFWKLAERQDGLECMPHEPREVRLSFHNWTFFWSLWHPTDSWKRGTPIWRHGSLALPEFFFGKRVYRKKEYETRSVTVPMPEGDYTGVATLYDAIFCFKRLPWKSRVSRVDIDLDATIPYSGKGENSWDCGEDGCAAQSTTAETIEEAIGNLVGYALEIRKQRGDPLKWPVYPPKPQSVA